MKVLFLVSYLTISSDVEFSKNKTGYGYMVCDIAESMSKIGVDVDVYTIFSITKGRDYKGFAILKRTWLDILMSIDFRYFGKMICFIKENKPSLGDIIWIVYYFLSMGYFERIVNHGDYDVVHIHGIGFATKPYIDCCEQLKIKYIVTLHGLNSFSESVKMGSAEKKFEKLFLRFAAKNNILLTVVSTGILNTISNFIDADASNIHVVTNGADLAEEENKINILNIREKYKIGNKNKIMLCVGNLTQRKNQLQIVRAYNLLPFRVKEKLSILFIGNDETGGEIKRNIYDHGLENNLILCGYVYKELMTSYYRQADYTILTSLSEGFGLSVIEGFVFGLPNLMYKDLDAVEDIFNEKAILVLSQRSDDALAYGITKMLSVDWDREYIRQYAEKFSLEKMGEKYLKIYQTLDVN